MCIVDNLKGVWNGKKVTATKQYIIQKMQTCDGLNNVLKLT